MASGEGSAPADEFDGFRIERLLGRGGMGAVYLAHDAILDRPVAIKFADDATGAFAPQQFFREARAIARLQHPNVVAIYRYGEANRCPYIAYEFVEGTSIAEMALPLRWPRALDLALQIARGLAAAHRASVLHRDIKPGNILVGRDGVAKLIDFGLAKLDGSATSDFPLDGTSDPAASSSVTLAGTPVYLAPELWLGDPPSPRSDVFSLGLVLYELVVGPIAVQLADRDVVGAGHLRDLPSVRASAADRVPELFAAVIDQCLAWEPGARFASAVDVRDALELVRAAIVPFAHDGEAPADDTHLHLVESLGRAIARPVGLAERFYQVLFARHPEVRAMFPPEMSRLRVNLTATLRLIVNQFGDPERMELTLSELGRRHAGYGVTAAHFEAVGAALLDVLAELDDADWTDELAADWRIAYARVADVMIRSLADPTLGTTTRLLRPLLDLPMEPPQIRYAHADDCAVAYQVMGQGAVDLLLIPGWPTNLDVGWRCAPIAQTRRRLATSARLLLVNPRGLGLSDHPRSLSTDDHARDSLAVLDHAGSERAVVVAFAEACAAAVLLAVAHPERVRALVLYAPRHGSNATDEARLEALRTGRADALTLDVYAPAFAADPALRRWWSEYVRGSGGPTAAAAYLRAVDRADVTDLLAGVGVPTVVVHRTGDRVCPVAGGRAVAAAIPGARFLEFAGDDHLPYAGDTQPVLKAVLDFLEALPAEPVGRLARLVTTLTVLGTGPAVRAALRTVRRSSGNVVERSPTDDFSATFASAHHAVRCALEISRAAEHKPGKLRIGIAAGMVGLPSEAAERPVEASRGLASCATHGQILASELVGRLLAGSDLRFGAGAGGVRLVLKSDG